MSDYSQRVTFWEGKIDPLIKAQTNHELVRTIHDWYQGTSDPPLPVIQEIDNRLRRFAAARQPQGVTFEQVKEVLLRESGKHGYVPNLPHVFIADVLDPLAALPWTTAPGDNSDDK